MCCEQNTKFTHCTFFASCPAAPPRRLHPSNYYFQKVRTDLILLLFGTCVKVQLQTMSGPESLDIIWSSCEKTASESPTESLGNTLLRCHRRGSTGQEAGQEGILTRADLPTPPEPNTTSLYSRMAGSLHQTAKQSAVDKWEKEQSRKDKLRKGVKKRERKHKKT